jgi:hypothetical protein
MKVTALTLLITASVFCNITNAQERLLKKSWIKVSIEEFSKKVETPDTTYLRYVFDNSIVLFGFEPSTHGLQLPFSRKGNTLTLGFDQWTIETLTDSTLTIFLPGFRRMKFFAEDYLQTKAGYLEQIGEYQGKPLYKTNKIITPRYKNPNGLINDVKKYDRADDYNIRKAGIFQMSFIVTDEGKIEQPKIIKSVAPGFDDGIIKELLKTSKHWTPAMFRGQPIQTLMMFEIKFLDSLTDH